MLIYTVYGFLITLIVYYLYYRPFDSFENNQMTGSILSKKKGDGFNGLNQGYVGNLKILSSIDYTIIYNFLRCFMSIKWNSLIKNCDIIHFYIYFLKKNKISFSR